MRIKSHIKRAKFFKPKVRGSAVVVVVAFIVVCVWVSV